MWEHKQSFTGWQSSRAVPLNHKYKLAGTLSSAAPLWSNKSWVFCSTSDVMDEDGEVTLLPPPLSHGAMFGPNKISHNKVNTNNIIHSLVFIYHLTPHIIKCLWQFYYWTSIRGEYQPLPTPSCIVLRPDKTLSWGGESRVRIFDISPILRSLGDETAVICKSNSFIPDITMLNQTPHIL